MLLSPFGRLSPFRRLSPLRPLAAALCLTLLPATVHAREVVITTTTHGIPHILAPDLEAAGHGAGYAYAAAGNTCLLADALVTVRGERSRVFGPDATVDLVGGRVSNLVSDTFFRAYLDDARLTIADPEADALIRGYAAGYNRFLAGTDPQKLPEACRGAPWVVPATQAALRRLLAERAIQASGGRFAEAIATAAPPGTDPAPQAATDPLTPPPALASNGYALGGDLTADGGGLLLGNPHFPWAGSLRFFALHVTVPGVIDVMGATLAPLPLPAIGFNARLAWTHTVSTSRRFVLHELRLVPGDPTAYLVDGVPERMVARDIAIPARLADGRETIITRRVWESRFGAVLAMPARGLAWTADTAWAIADPERSDTRLVAQWLRLGQAGSVAEAQAALIATRGTPWTNTLMADQSGRAGYADLTGVPPVTDALARSCAPTAGAEAIARAGHITILAGDRAACAVPGLMPAAMMPVRNSRRLFMNANDSYWLSDPEAPLTGLASILGPTEVPQRLRTRMSARQLGELTGRPGPAVAPSDLEAMLFSERNLAADLALDAVLTSCAGQADLAEACTVLARWDRVSAPAARGAGLFRQVWRRLGADPGRSGRFWSVPFDPARPFDTPRAPDAHDPATAALLRAALRGAVADFRAAGLALDAPLGTLQQRDGIPLRGGDDAEGMLDNLGLGALGPAGGFDTARAYGTSWVQLVRWRALPDGGTVPVARGLLTYGQSADPASPFHTDQTRLYAAGRLFDLPFTAEDIAADPARSETVLDLPD